MSALANHSASAFPLDARALVTTVAWLRPCAALGQILAIAAAIGWLHVVLPLPQLAAGVALLTIATPVAFWRLRRAWPVSGIEATGHLVFDVTALAWALYFTGGASNPFITLLLVPVALAAVALSARATGLSVVFTLVAYAVLMFHYVPLPDMSLHGGVGFRLHVTGMAINFLIAALLLATFIGRMTASLRAQRDATVRLRERMLRNEGILAVATQAAEAAHELNTPLSTLRTLLPELEREREHDAALRADVVVMVAEVERCRAILQRMVTRGRDQLAGETRVTTLGAYVQASIQRFQLLCPQADVLARIDAADADCPIEVSPGLAHALLNLLHNAFDASVQNYSRRVTLEAGVCDGELEFVIADRGCGLPDGALDGVSPNSNKPNGLGIGLALARATVERLRGELRAQGGANGTRIQVRLPCAHGSQS
jgi:two-component system sensor histidine kinase RegB